MRVKVTNICRGRGAAYILFTVDQFKHKCSLSVESYSEEGRPLPVETYAQPDSARDRSSFVALVPLLDTKKVVLVVKVSNESGEQIYGRTINLSRFAIKWLSRLNYKVSYDRAMQIRDIEKSTYVRQIHIVPQVYLLSPDAQTQIIKGYACAPSYEKVHFSVLDGFGRIVSERISLTEGKCSDSAVLGLERKELAFTLRVPNNGNTYCLVAQGCQDSRSGFLCLDADSRHDYSWSRSPYFYKCTAAEPYSAWVKSHQRLLDAIEPHSFNCPDGPFFSVVVPLYNTPVDFFNDMVNSVLSQVYGRFELVLVNSTPENVQLSDAISHIEDDRVKVVSLESNLGIAGNTNKGIEASSGDYIVFFDHDDLLDPFALYKYACQIINNDSIDALYCDEDFLNEAGEFVAPHFKSDFNIDLLRVHNYITHLLCVRSGLVRQLMIRSEFDGAQDYDFILRLSELTQNFCHVPAVLYHWRMSETSTAKSAGNKGYADEAGRRALQAHLDRCGLNAVAESTEAPCYYHVTYEVSGSPLISILIPNKDNISVLKRCVDSIETLTTYRNFEIRIIENNSVEPDTFDYYQSVVNTFDNVYVDYWDREFNYSAINNFGFLNSSGDYILLLNNDVEVISPNWLASLLALCQRNDVGVAGAKLLFPDNTVQHAGVEMIKCFSASEVGGPIHVFSHLDRDDAGYMRRASVRQDVSVVTGACLLVKRSVYQELNGLDESFAVAFNDVDFCLRAREAGYLVVYEPDALLYHYESLSRGSDASSTNYERFMREQGMLRSRWSSYYKNGDPYYHPASTCSDCSMFMD